MRGARDQSVIESVIQEERSALWLRLLLSYNANANWGDVKGKTALHVAAVSGQEHYMRELVVFGGGDLGLVGNIYGVGVREDTVLGVTVKLGIARRDLLAELVVSEGEW